MKLKKILAFILIAICIPLITGCAKIEYQRVVTEEGTIMDAVSVKLDKNKITSAGFDYDEVKTDVFSKMNYYLNAVIDGFKYRDDNLTSVEKDAILFNISRNCYENNEGYIIAYLKFNNYNIFRYFYGLHLLDEETLNAGTKTEEKFLVDKYISSGKTIFSGLDCQYITNDFMAYFNNNFTLNDADLSYVFGTYQTKLHSDANFQFTEDGIKYHEWIVTDVQQDINTYTYTIKPVNWYILSLILTLFLIIVLFIISYISKFSKAKKESKLNAISLINLEEENLINLNDKKE